MKIEIDDEIADVIVSEFCREHIGFCDRYLAELYERMKSGPLPPYLITDLADTLQHRLHLVAVYNYCNKEKWRDDVQILD